MSHSGMRELLLSLRAGGGMGRTSPDTPSIYTVHPHDIVSLCPVVQTGSAAERETACRAQEWLLSNIQK